MPPTIVAPDRETPGTSASIWHMPMPSARDTGVRSASTNGRSGRCCSTSEHHDAAGDERERDDTRRLSYSTVCT